MSVSAEVGSVSNVRASYESFKPSLSLSARCGFVEVMPSTSAVNVKQPWSGSQGDVVSVTAPSGPFLKHGLGPHIESHVGLTYSRRLFKPSPSGSPLGPSALDADVAFRPLAASQPSGIPSPSVSQPATSSSSIPSPSSSLELQSASPSPSGSAESTVPSLSSSNPLAQIFPTGSSSQRIVFPVPSAPEEPQAGLLYCIAFSSSQLLTGTVPFHQTPLSRIVGVALLSHPLGIK